MKLYSIANLFEFKDDIASGVLESLLFNVNNLQGLGIPDLCVVSRRQSQGMFKSQTDQSSAFHFIQGYCATSQAEISAYIQQLLMNQEKEANSKMFGSDVVIFKITYTIYDVFSKTLLVCSFEQPEDGLTQFKTYGVQGNRTITQLTKGHWEGAYVSSALRAIDQYNRVPNIGRFFNNLNLANPVKLTEFVKKLFNLLQNQDNRFQDLNKIKSKNDFPDVDEIIYYLNYPLYILVNYMEECSQLDLLLKVIDCLEDNIIINIIKGVICYKMKNYENCIRVLKGIQHFILTQYVQAKAFIKLKQYQNAFILLQDLIFEAYNNPLLWIALSEIFRKSQLYQVSLIFLNKASTLTLSTKVKFLLIKQNIENYRVVTQHKNLISPNQLEGFYKIISPIKVDKLESFSQICSYPQLDQLFIRQRQQGKKDHKTYDSLIKMMQRQEYKVNQQACDKINNNSLLDCEECSDPLVKETFKLFQSVGFNKIKSLIRQLFYQKPQILKKIDQIYDPSEFAITLQNKKSYMILNVSSISCTNKSLIEQTDEGDDSDEEKPSFLKNGQKLNKSFDFGSVIPKYQTPQNQHRPKSPIKFSSIKKKPVQLKKANTIIVENAFESIESERQNQQFTQLLNESCTAQAPKSGQDSQPIFKNLYALHQYLQEDLTQLEQTQMIDQLLRRKENIQPQFAELIDSIVKTLSELEQLFYVSNDKPQIQIMPSQTNSTAPSPQIHSPIFKSNLKKTLQNKQHLEKQAVFRDFYMVPSQDLEDTEMREKYCLTQLKSEAVFLFKCAKLAKIFKRNELALQILNRLQSKIISVHVSSLILKMIKNEPKLIIRQIQKTLADFNECGINYISHIPIWMEQIIIKLTKTLGANQILSLLSNSDTDFTFYLIKKVVLSAENLA